MTRRSGRLAAACTRAALFRPKQQRQFVWLERGEPTAELAPPAVDGRLPLRLAKEQRRVHYRKPLLEVVQRGRRKLDARDARDHMERAKRRRRGLLVECARALADGGLLVHDEEACAGLDVRGYVPNLYEHLAVCDLAIVPGGLSTTMELTAARRPFLYFPLAHHFEQLHAVAHRLDVHRAGRRLTYANTNAEALAAAALDALGADTRGYKVPQPGAADRAATLIADLL